MKNFIMAFAVSVVLLSCTTDQSKKLDVVGQINQDMIKNPSAAGGTGTNYYVCDDGNDDANDGLSEETPWKSFAKGMSKFKSMNAGDAVLFCRGGVFTSLKSEVIANFNCSVDAPCIISDYYNPVSQVEDAIPLIISQHSGHVFSFQDKGNADHDEGYLLENFNLKGSSIESGTGVFFYNDVDDVQLSNIAISSLKIGINIGGANTPNEGSNKLNERITVSEVTQENLKYFILGVGAAELLSSLTVVDSVVAVIEPEPAVAVPVKLGGPYFVCDTGDDANSGLSPYSPWRTYSKAMQYFNSLKAGESISFCRGGVFYAEGSPRLYNTKCTAANVCRVGDYYSGIKGSGSTTERPKLISSTGAAVFNFQDPGNADQDGGYLIENLILESNVATKAAIFLFNDVDDLTVRNVKIDGFGIGIQSAATNTLNEGSNSKNERIIFEKNEIVNNSAQGWLGECSDCVIASNHFENNGYAKASLDHNLYFAAKDASNVLIKNNTFKKSTHINGYCQGVSLVVHGKVKYMTIENNLVEEEVNKVGNGCWGIAVDPGYNSMDESFENIVIRGNTVINTGNLGIGCASCLNVVIENNTIISENSDIGFTGVGVPNREEDSLLSSNITVRNNKVILSSISNKLKFGFKIVPEDGSLTVNNNKVYSDYSDILCAILQGVDTVQDDQCMVVQD